MSCLMMSGDLGDICRDLLEGEAWNKRDRVLQLGKLLSSHRDFGLDFSNPADGETTTPAGLAVSPRWAEMCLDDHVRTICFLRGVDSAIRQSLVKNPGQPVRVFYAGCGPFGTLCVPLMAVYPASQVQFTLLDIHQVSINSVRSIIHNLGLSQSIDRYITGDAIQVIFETSRRPDVIVAEVMQSALDKEPQVVVTRHLLDQAPDAIMVPEKISVDLALVNLSREFCANADNTPRDHIEVGSVFHLDKEKVKAWRECGEATLPAGCLSLPDYDRGKYQPMLMTRITCAKGHVLTDHQSGLTIPKAHSSLESAVPQAVLQFSYRLGNDPGLLAQQVT